jgi:hypothetical protein
MLAKLSSVSQARMKLVLISRRYSCSARASEFPRPGLEAREHQRCGAPPVTIDDASRSSSFPSGAMSSERSLWVRSVDILDAKTRPRSLDCEVAPTADHVAGHRALSTSIMVRRRSPMFLRTKGDHSPDCQCDLLGTTDPDVPDAWRSRDRAITHGSTARPRNVSSRWAAA